MICCVTDLYFFVCALVDVCCLFCRPHHSQATGLSMVETDGPYGGQSCGSTQHDHYGADDSITAQWTNQAAFYSELRARGVFVHAPDDYLFAGGANKFCGWYSEMQYSLPRWQWISISHQEVFDHTYVIFITFFQVENCFTVG